MSEDRTYNPLDKDHLAESIVREFFKGQLHPLPPSESFAGAGIYALYYQGAFPLYSRISTSLIHFLASESESTEDQPIPIYIGKSDPPGSRKGLFEHAASISAAQNLKIADFQCRYMLVDEVWLALGEARLVDWFRPVWNVLIEGFGSKVEGGGRGSTARSVWD